MKLYNNSIRDVRVRDYLPVRRIVWSNKAVNPEIFVDSYENQIFSAPESAVCRLEKNGSVLVDFGIELHGGVRIHNTGDKSSGRIRLRFGESVSEAMGEPNQDHSIHDTELDVPLYGTLEYGSTAFRFLRIDNLGEPLKLLNIMAVSLTRDMDYDGSFESSDERLNKIWKTAVYTIHLNMQEYLFDGVKRDRLVWMGDMHPEIRGILCAFSDTSVIRSSFDFLTEKHPLPQPMRIYTYSCWWVIALFDYFIATGDRGYLEKKRAYLTGLLEQFSSYVTPDGRECVPEKRFLDWPTRENEQAKHAGIQGLLLWMMNSGEKLLKVLGEDTSKVCRAASLLKKHIPDCGNSKQAAALMTVSGLADKSSVLLADPYKGVSTFYGFYMLLGQPTANALDLIRKYWGAMLDYGATTFWEDFDLDWIKNTTPITEMPVPEKDDLHKDFGNYCYKGLRHSLCHGWSGGPAPFMSERVFGIRFLEPGGRKITVDPDLGGLEYVKGSLPTPHGVIKIETDRSGKVKLDVPGDIEVCGR